MNARVGRVRTPQVTGLVGATLIALAAVLSRTESDELLRFALTFDVAVTLPLLYYVAIVRRGRAAMITILPVIVLTQIAVRVALVGDPGLIQSMELVLIPLEIGVLTFVVLRVRRAIARAEHASDLPETIRRVCDEVLPHPRVASMLASELTILWYGLTGWRIRTIEPSGSSTTFHRRSGWGSVVAGVVLLILSEGIAIHLLLDLWSPTVAWIVTALDVWGIVWLLGDYHGLRTIDSRIDGDDLLLRMGLRWTARIPLSNIREVSTTDHPEKSASAIHFNLIEDPTVTIHFLKPVELTGMMGIRRNAASISMTPDNAGFARLLAARNARDDDETR